jgi:hypothetical protein
MLSIQAISEALRDWAMTTCPELNQVYAVPPEQRTEPLPDAAAESQNVETFFEHEQFPQFRIQQVMLRVHEFNLLLVVPPDPPDTATNLLTGFIDTLTERILSDVSLGGRVPAVALTFRASMVPPFVEFEDKTRGRLATLTLLVADTIDPEEL